MNSYFKKIDPRSGANPFLGGGGVALECRFFEKLLLLTYGNLNFFYFCPSKLFLAPDSSDFIHRFPNFNKNLPFFNN